MRHLSPADAVRCGGYDGDVMRKMLAVLLCLWLGGCASRAEILAQRDAEDRARCRAHGIEPGSEVYLQCLAMLADQRSLDDQRRQQAALALMSMGLDTMANNH
jgi:hypothetical protein